MSNHQLGKELKRLAILVALLMAIWVPLSLVATESEQPRSVFQSCDPQSKQASGANYLICMPLFGWNQKLIVYAHEYIAPNEPLMDIPANTDIMALAARVNLLGYAFAVTSYSQNGLAVQEGIEDVIDLALLFEQQKGTPDKKYVLGVSQGGLISALTLERHPELFDGGWALCGPYGDFREQSDYFAHARVLFDYFFPDVLAGSPIEASASLMDNWGSFYAKVMQPILTDSANAHRVDQLLATAGIAFNADDENSKAAAIETVLWYNTFTVNDGIERFGGQPFDNMDTVYSGSEDDTKLNDEVARFVADAAALAAQEQYQTTGALRRPLITIHTTRDPLMPYVQLERYQEKINQAGAGVYYQHIESNSYGHCQFSDSEILQSLNQLEALVESAPAISTDAQNINIFLPIVMKAN